MPVIKREYPSSSSSAVYTAQFDTETGQSSCNCKGWTMKRGDKPRGCKHTKDLEGTKVGGVTVAKLAPPVPATPDPVTPFDTLQDSGPVPPTVKPMAASAMKEDASLADFLTPEWVMEEKYDGHRLTVIVTADKKVSGWSRPGAERPAALRPLPPALVAELVQLPVGVYDGELYIPGGTSSDVVRLDLKDKLRLALFDVVESLGKSVMDLPLIARREVLRLSVAHVAGTRVVLAPQEPVSIKAVQGIWDRGGEGAILKKIDSTYKSGWRTPNWIKVKAIGAAELTITGYEAGKGGPNSVFLLKHDDGRQTKVKVLTNELLAAVSASPAKYVGRRVTISYMGLTSTGVWRHPIFDHFTEGA
jgi:hypothetical protein